MTTAVLRRGAPAPVGQVVEVGGGAFPVAAAQADATANPTTTNVGAFGSAFNGTTWDRIRSGLVAVQTTFTGIVNSLSMGRYNATPPTLADGNAVVLQVDAAGNLKGVEQYAPAAEDNTNGVLAHVTKPLAVSTYCATLYTYFAGAVTKANVKASAGNVYSFTVTNRNAAARYFLLHNKASAPAAAEAGLVAFMVPAGSTLTIGDQWFRDAGVNFATGIGWSIGTTVATFTDSATASEHEVQIQYK